MPIELNRKTSTLTSTRRHRGQEYEKLLLRGKFLENALAGVEVRVPEDIFAAVLKDLINNVPGVKEYLKQEVGTEGVLVRINGKKLVEATAVPAPLEP